MTENIPIRKYFDEIRKLFKLVNKEHILFAEPELYMPDASIDPPVVTYKILERRADKRHTGMKPSIKYASDFNEEEYHGQIFESNILFSIYGKDYVAINQTREWFEEFMIRHNNKLKKNNIIESVFQQQLEDETVEINQNYFIKQSMIYLVRTPRAFKLSYRPIESIESEIRNKEE